MLSYIASIFLSGINFLATHICIEDTLNLNLGSKINNLTSKKTISSLTFFNLYIEKVISLLQFYGIMKCQLQSP